MLLLLPEIPDAATAELKNAIAIRNLCATRGVCPDCGARGVRSAGDHRLLTHLTFRHERGCRVVADGEAAA